VLVLSLSVGVGFQSPDGESWTGRGARAVEDAEDAGEGGAVLTVAGWKGTTATSAMVVCIW